MHLDSVLEIGVEDLPPQMVKSALEQLYQKGGAYLKEHRLEYKKIHVWGSSRRLIFYIEELKSTQEDLIEKESGPPKNVVFDSEGRLTEAGKRYLEAKKVKAKQLEIEKTKKGEYVYIKRTHRGRETIQILPAIFTQLISGLHFAKNMRWKEGNFYFGRPIRYILALFGDRVVHFNIAGVSSGRKTKGHFYLNPEFVEVPTASSYGEILKKARVIFDPEERREKIMIQIQKIIGQLKKRGYPEAQMIPDEELLEKLIYLVEYPTVFVGQFDPEFLKLPSFILKTCLRGYQQQFTVGGKNGILPFFIGIRDGNERNLSEIIEGNRRVLHARLRDAEFFYREDRKISLEKRVPLLKEIVVQERLGSYYDKVERVIKLVQDLCSLLDISESDQKVIVRAAYLCKADLLTNMVREFPELQGIVGANYALYFGEDPRVAKSIEEHRKPRSNQDEIPESLEGAILAIADKMDTLAGAFWINFIPTGSEDPWGLRREAQGILEIIVGKQFDFSLQELIDRAVNLYGEGKEVGEKLKDFFESRIRLLLREKNIPYDQINAVMKTETFNLVDIFSRAWTLKEIIQREDYKREVMAIIRLVNILKQAREWKIKLPGKINEEMLIQEEEKCLYQKWKNIKGEVLEYIEKREYKKAYERLSELKDLIHDFFEKVLVMSEDMNLRLNRLAMLNQIGQVFLRIADFSELQVK